MNFLASFAFFFRPLKVKQYHCMIVQIETKNHTFVAFEIFTQMRILDFTLKNINFIEKQNETYFHKRLIVYE